MFFFIVEDNAGLAAKECDDSAQKESLNEEEGEEEMEDSSPEEEEETLQKARQAITCRSVTLTTLMDDGIIQAGEGVLSIDYLVMIFIVYGKTYAQNTSSTSYLNSKAFSHFLIDFIRKKNVLA